MPDGPAAPHPCILSFPNVYPPHTCGYKSIGNPGERVQGGSPTGTFGDDGGKMVVVLKPSKVLKTFEGWVINNHYGGTAPYYTDLG